MIYTVPTTKAKQFLEENDYVMASDEGEAVAMAVGDYLATGNIPIVVMGENGLLNALDALITLVNLYEVPIDLRLYVRDDEIQHKMVADGVRDILDIYKIKATILW